MPPPNVFDPWLSSRRFGLVIDAGSSGSRLQIYSWKDARSENYEHGLAVAHSLPRVEKGAKEGEQWVKKVEPGISTYAEHPSDVSDHLRPLLLHAQEHVPPSLQPETPIFLLATAGMRLLSSPKQTALISATCDFIRFHSHFRLDNPSIIGPCGSSVRVISGEDEGLFGWIAINYLTDGFNGVAGEERQTYGFLDMGGASTQIAFEPAPRHRNVHEKLRGVRLRRLGGSEIVHHVFVSTWLGFGTNKARERYVRHMIDQLSKLKASGSEGFHVYDPCLPKNLTLVEAPTHSGSEGSQAERYTLIGSGSFTECLNTTQPLLNKGKPCDDLPCMFDGIHVPAIDFTVSKFIGVSEYWYSSEHIFGLGGPYDFVQYERAASEFCARDWDELVRKHEKASDQQHIGGDGEVMEDGEIVAVGKWGKNVERHRLEMQCFKAAWIANVLHEGIGLPRLTDYGGNQTTEADRVVQKASQKGLGRPAFQSLDTIGETAISWTLGKMVLEACKEVPPVSSSAQPLLDPVEIYQTPEEATGPMQEPGRNPSGLDDLEDRIHDRLPPSLKFKSLGFSIVTLLFYVIAFFSLLAILSRIRGRLRWCIRRLRRLSWRHDHGTFEQFMTEEGKVNGLSPPQPTRPVSLSNSSARRMSSLLSYFFRRLYASSSGGLRPQQPSSLLATHMPKELHDRPITSPQSHSFPLYPGESGANSGHTQYALSKSSMQDEPPQTAALFGHSLYGLSTSRNASQVNLSSTLTPRVFAFTAARTVAGGNSAPGTPRLSIPTEDC